MSSGRRMVATLSGRLLPWLRRRGIDVRRVDVSGVWRDVSAFTLTDPPRIAAVADAVRFLDRAGISGDLVECGVYRGGSMMAAALTHLEQGAPTRTLWLYDTFAGMPAPTERDVALLSGQPAATKYSRLRRRDGGSDWDRATEEEVAQNIRSTGYPMESVRMVPGMVEETLVKSRPDRIALLRLDTDWYTSTLVTMEHLFPLLVPGGILIVDDYGFWRGAREAVDEYLESHHAPLLFLPIGAGAVVGVKVTP